jgi:ubiquinol-cytochrome c reductase cytochrome c1 subunit
MKKKLLAIFCLVACAVSPVMVSASGGGVHLDKAEIDLGNQEVLQRGAKLFVNYCMGCHSIKYMSYSRMGEDIGLTEEQVMDNLMLPGSKIGDYMKISMSDAQAKEWFGVSPPDLSVVSRSRGNDWLYTYLRSFYMDESRPFGVNNLVFKDVAMPHVMSGLEGMKKAIFDEEKNEHGRVLMVFKGYEQVSAGSMNTAVFDRAMLDLTTFLDYVGEPAKLKRQQLGIWVLSFLAIFLVISYLLKKEYWKDIH